MMVEKLLTPCGVISVLKNGTPILFDVADSQFNSMWLDGNTAGEEIMVNADGCIGITIDTQCLAVGDIIVCALDKDIVRNDGGGERILNTAGQYNGFDIALGAPATDDYEYDWDPHSPDLPSDIYPTKRFLCYTCEFCPGGFEFEIVDDPKQYNDRPCRKNIFVTAAWCNSEKPYAYDIVSFLSTL